MKKAIILLALVAGCGKADPIKPPEPAQKKEEPTAKRKEVSGEMKRFIEEARSVANTIKFNANASITDGIKRIDDAFTRIPERSEWHPMALKVRDEARAMMVAAITISLAEKNLKGGQDLLAFAEKNLARFDPKSENTDKALLAKAQAEVDKWRGDIAKTKQTLDKHTAELDNHRQEFLRQTSELEKLLE